MAYVPVVLHGQNKVSSVYGLVCNSKSYALTILSSIGNAKIAGMSEDLELDSQRYSIALVVFFVGYVVFEVPSKLVH